MFQTSFILIILLYSLLSKSNSLKINVWTLYNANRSIIINNVTSPIDVYTALFDHSIIDWPLKGYNDRLYRWIAYDNWTFTSNKFSTPPSNQSLLSLSGLDVYPTVTLNCNPINVTLTEFNTVDIPLDSNILKRSNNVLKLTFTSPPLLAKQIRQRYRQTIPPDCWPKLFNGECNINMLRKTQSSFGWDWGPAIPTMGIRGGIDLRMTNKTLVFIKGVRFITDLDSNCQIWIAYVKVKLRVLQVPIMQTICINIKIDSLDIKMTQCLITEDSSIYFVNFTLSGDTSQLKLWWPREMGTPTAYKLEVTASFYNMVMDNFFEYIGFRKVELNQSLLSDGNGRHFKFNVNCKPFFVKGTNLVPRSYMTSDWNNISKLEFLLSSVAEANINTIRIWGGGLPELKLFYTIADRLGIMIWHDLMFAGSLYPDDTKFHEQIKGEVTDLLWSTQIHPSLLVWSGNNEIELLIAGGWYGTKPMDPNYIASYNKTFTQLIKSLVKELDPFTPFVLSSPSNGIKSEQNDGGVSLDPQSPNYGDVHFYLYSGELWEEESYPISRMTTEFGFQSYPSTDTWAQITVSENDFDPNGTLANHRQHLVHGFQICQSAIIKYFGKIKPFGEHSLRDQYTWFSYLSQVNQAVVLKVHINRLRTNQCSLTSNGTGYTSGAMFWQLNDNWITPSWSTIEANGQWKLAHYYIKQAFTAERIIVAINDTTISIRLVLPEIFPKTLYKVILTCIDSSKLASVSITGQEVVYANSELFSCNVVTILSESVKGFLRDCRCVDTDRCIVEGALWNKGKAVSVDSAMMVKPKDLHLPREVRKDVINVTKRNDDPDVSICMLTLSSKFVHLYVSLSTNSLGQFSNNGFHLWQKKYNVTFYPWYNHQNEFFNCSNLIVNIMSLNEFLT